MASDAAAADQFGNSVAISGETVVVGAPLDDGAAGPNQGSAYVFVRSGGVWSQQQKLLASDAAASDKFGNSVAISGETIVVGARFDAGAAGNAQGSAYVFVRSGGAGASSRSSWPRTRRHLTSSASRWRSAGRRSWSARRVMMAQRASTKARPMSLCVAVESGSRSRSWWPRTRRQVTSSASRWRSAGDGRGRRAA